MPKHSANNHTAASFRIWPNATQTRYAAVLGDMTGIQGKGLYALWNGKSVAEDFPSVEFAMSPDFPDNTELSDNLMNKHHLIIGSERLKNFLEARATPKLEFLPVTIRDHKNKKVGAPYFIVNPLDAVDCLDKEASGAVASPSLATHIISIKKLVLRDDAIDAERPLFRLAGYPQIRLVRNDLAEAIETEFGIQAKTIDEKNG